LIMMVNQLWPKHYLLDSLKVILYLNKVWYQFC
jgi:hypothetical protein